MDSIFYELNSSQLSKKLELIDFTGTADELDEELLRIHREQSINTVYKVELRLISMSENPHVLPKHIFIVEGWKYSNLGTYGYGVQKFTPTSSNRIYIRRYYNTESAWETITME